MYKVNKDQNSATCSPWLRRTITVHRRCCTFPTLQPKVLDAQRLNSQVKTAFDRALATKPLLTEIRRPVPPYATPSPRHNHSLTSARRKWRQTFSGSPAGPPAKQAIRNSRLPVPFRSDAERAVTAQPLSPELHESPTIASRKFTIVNSFHPGWRHKTYSLDAKTPDFL